MNPKLRPFITTLFLTTFFSSVAFASSYGNLLEKVVADHGVRLGNWGSNNRSLLKNALKDFGDRKLSEIKTQDGQLAFWINAHNLCVVHLLQKKWPVKDVMGISGFRDQLTCRIAGADRTLYEMDSGIIRPRFKDPRTRLALWWGTKGGPPLAKSPFEKDSIDKDLNDQVKRALEGNRLVWIDQDTDTLRVSPLFEWYRGDFGKSDEDVLKFLKKHMPEERAEDLPKTYREIRFGSFDWTVDTPGLAENDH